MNLIEMILLFIFLEQLIALCCTPFVTERVNGFYIRLMELCGFAVEWLILVVI